MKKQLKGKQLMEKELMEIHSMGMNVKHEDKFLIDRPVGLGDNLFLLFKSEASLWLNDLRKELSPGSFILYPKNVMQKYGASDTEYINHYIHFECDRGYFDKIGIYTNCPGYLANIEEIENLLRLISRERISESAFQKENIDLLLQLLLRKVAENQAKEPIRGNERRHLEELTKLRSEMYSTPGKYNSINDMASSVNLSSSHFQAIYSDFFAVSCYEDLLNAKIGSACNYLAHSEMTIREIAILCGYENDTCFMRSFKKRTGQTPSQYRGNSR